MTLVADRYEPMMKMGQGALSRSVFDGIANSILDNSATRENV